MRMNKKILFIVDHLGLGGAEKVTLELAEYLARHRHQITLAVLNSQRNYYKVPDTIHYIDLQFSEFFSYGKLWKDRKLNAEEQCRIDQLLNQNDFQLIVTGYNNGHWLRPYLKGNVWHWIHGDLIEKRSATNIFKRYREVLRALRHQKKFVHLFEGANIITVSQTLLDKYKQILKHATFVNISNGVDQEKLLSVSADTDPQKQWDTIFVGRLHKIKQVDHALTAFAKSNLNGRMAIVGDGPERNELEQMAQRLGIQHQVDFIGSVSNPGFYMLKSRSLILSSFAEGAPMCIAEALSLGIPVVAYACSSGIREQLGQAHLQQGLVTPQAVDELAATLNHVVTTPYPIYKDDKARLSMETMALEFLKLSL